MTKRYCIPKLVATVFILNGVLCPCAATANQIDTAPQSHHHAAAGATGDCHGVADNKVCTTAMADTALPKSLASASDQFQADDPVIWISPTSDILADRRFSGREALNQRDSLPALSTPVSRNDRLLD